MLRTGGGTADTHTKRQTDMLGRKTGPQLHPGNFAYLTKNEQKIKMNKKSGEGVAHFSYLS